MPMPRPLADLAPHALASATRLYFDVDDTLTHHGKLPAETVASLFSAQEAGLSLVAVTGRSAAWGEMMLRVLPFDAVVAETGALCFYFQSSGAAAVLHSEPDAAIRRANVQRREAVSERVLDEVESARLALDNLGRLYDTAFDLVEDGPALGESVTAAIRAILDQEKITWAQSSVHINAWIGTFNKASMVDRYLREIEATSLDEAADQLIYVGDSTNDGAMFCRTPLSVGVANVAPHLEKLDAAGQTPRYLTQGEGGLGFAELVRAILRARETKG